MGLFSKDEKIPSIPKAPALPELPQPESIKKKDLPELPTFPSNSQNENINQQMVKSAVSEMPSPTQNETITNIPTVTTREQSVPTMKSSELPPIPTLPSIPERIPSVKPLSSMPPMPNSQLPKPSLNEPIFVRLDKFQTSQKHLESIKEKIAKVEITLRKIEEVKAKEEAELKAWIEDINHVKMKISEIDKDIFDQI